jgi:hypothetical protein
MRPGCCRHRTAGIGAILVLAVHLLSVCARAEADDDPQDLIRRQFEIYDPDYQKHFEYYGNRLEAMSRSIAQAEASGQSLHCTQQLFLEAKWLHGYTALWDRLEDKLKRIEQSLDDRDQSFAAQQSPVDGLWGPCYEEHFMRLGATVDGLASLAARGQQPRYRLRPTGRMDTGKKLLSRLQDLLVSDIAHTGVDNRAELGSLITTIAQGTLKPYLRDMLVENIDLTHPSDRVNSLTEAFRFFLNGAQDPTTGYWGAWYIVDDKIIKTIDLSMTYHIVAYTKGGVDYWPQIIDKTQAIEAGSYPYGWRHNGRYNNHNLYNVAKIYKFGWPHTSEPTRSKLGQQIASMLDWSLKNTLGPDGTFLHDPTFSDSLADEYYFGVSFLDEIGYWRSEKRFWTNAPVDQGAPALCCRLKHRLKDLDLEGWAADGAMVKLEGSCGQC